MCVNKGLYGLHINLHCQCVFELGEAAGVRALSSELRDVIACVSVEKTVRQRGHE